MSDPDDDLNAYVDAQFFKVVDFLNTIPEYAQKLKETPVRQDIVDASQLEYENKQRLDTSLGDLRPGAVEVMFQKLRELEPKATDNEIHHQLEYLKYRVVDGKVELHGPTSGEKPVLLNSFFGKESTVLPMVHATLTSFLFRRTESRKLEWYEHHLRVQVTHAKLALGGMQIQPLELGITRDWMNILDMWCLQHLKHGLSDLNGYLGLKLLVDRRLTVYSDKKDGRFIVLDDPLEVP